MDTFFRTRSAEELAGLFREVLDSLDTGVLITDPGRPDNPIVYANGGFGRLTGYAPAEVVGRNCRFLQEDDRDQPAIAEVRRALAEARQVRVVLRNYKRSGELFYNELTLAPIRGEDGRARLFIGFQIDVTARELALRELEASNQRLVESDRRIAHILRAVAHELRTPLTVAQGHLELAQQRAGSDSKLGGHLEATRATLERLDLLVHDLIDSARVEAGLLRLDPEPIDLVALARMTLDTFAPVAAAAGVELRFEAVTATAPAVADPARVVRVVKSLVDNAIRFNRPRGSVVVRVGQVPDGCTCEVVDTGPGISAEDRARVFQPFVQLGFDPPEGIGLGLSLARALVEAHGGQIGVASEPGRGSRFWFRIPRRPVVR